MILLTCLQLQLLLNKVDEANISRQTKEEIREELVKVSPDTCISPVYKN